MTATDRINAFVVKHKLIFEDHGECGFGRPCVGLISKRGSYLDYNPFSLSEDDNFAPIAGFQDARLRSPRGVNEYHKHECYAVVVEDNDYEKAIEQLAEWVDHLELLDVEVEVAEYETGATGLQVAMSGLTGYALRVKTECS